jgi:F0F1-type ATP synthase assembly protein I
MDKILGLVTGFFTFGWFRGHRTELIALGLVVNGVIGFLVGDLNILDFIKQNWEQFALAAGLLTAAAHKPTA